MDGPANGRKERAGCGVKLSLCEVREREPRAQPLATGRASVGLGSHCLHNQVREREGPHALPS